MELNIMGRRVEVDIDIFSSFYDIVTEAKLVVWAKELEADEVERIVHAIQMKQLQENQELYKIKKKS